MASYDIHASNPHLISTSPQGRGVSRNNDRCIRFDIVLVAVAYRGRLLFSGLAL